MMSEGRHIPNCQHMNICPCKCIIFYNYKNLKWSHVSCKGQTWNSLGINTICLTKLINQNIYSSHYIHCYVNCMSLTHLDYTSFGSVYIILVYTQEPTTANKSYCLFQKGAVHNCQHSNECTKHTPITRESNTPLPLTKWIYKKKLNWIICHDNDKNGLKYVFPLTPPLKETTPKHIWNQLGKVYPP